MVSGREYIWIDYYGPGRMITLKGVEPISKKQWKRGNFYIYGVVEAATSAQYYQEFFCSITTVFKSF
jgi:hypothetical protein